jgi:hypothetical protein
MIVRLFAVLALSVLPGLALAQACPDLDPRNTPASCGPESAWDATYRACILTAS